MSLKQRIEKAYKDWENESRELAKNIDSPSNYKEVFANVKKTKKDLCKFADDFDNYTKTLSANYDKPLPQTIVDDMYKNIRENFVERIAKEKNNFIYIDGKTKPLSETIKTFRPAFEYIQSGFTASNDLASFLEEAGKKLGSSLGDNINLQDLNTHLINFICVILSSIRKELELETKFLVAKDKDYFYTEKDSNFFSRKIFRKLFPDVWSYYQNREKCDKHMIEKVKNDVKVFPLMIPSPKEVKQANIGDCYLMATLIALAKTNPKAIMDCFVQGSDKIEKEENIDIRFFRYIDYEKAPVIIRVNKKRVIMPQYIKDGALWPKLIEKAYAIYIKKGYAHSDNNLHGSMPSNAMFAITGKVAHRASNGEYSPEKFSPENIISTIKRKLEKSKSLTCTFKNKFKTKDMKSKENISIYNEHVYAIVGINEAQKYIRLINPWKRNPLFGLIKGGRKETNSPKSKEGGHIAMSFGDFKKHFESIEYTSNKDL